MPLLKKALGMIELKDGGMAVGMKWLFRGVSFCAKAGQMVGVTGPHGCGKTMLIEAMMGTRPLAEGYVSVDGEPVLAPTAGLFRGMMAYVPQDVRMCCASVADLFDMLTGLYANAEVERPKKHLLAEWRKLGVKGDLYAHALADVDGSTLRLMMLAVAGALHRPIVLMDDPTATMDAERAAKALAYMQSLAQTGAAVVVATADERVLGTCQQVVTLRRNDND